jgi:hypothetical protein
VLLCHAGHMQSFSSQSVANCDAADECIPVQIVRLLMEAGASPSVLNRFGSTSFTA